MKHYKQLLAGLVLFTALFSSVTSWAVDFAVVQAAMNTSTGTQDFTSSGFGTPKCAIFFTGYGTANGTAVAHAGLSLGATDGTRNFANSWAAEDNVNPTDTNGLASAVATVLVQAPGSATQDGLAAFDSWITDGVRINWSDASPTAYLLNVILIGGTGVSNCYVNTVTPTNTVDLATDVTAPGFEPSFILFWSNSGSGQSRPSLGLVVNDGSSTQRSGTLRDTDNVSPSEATSNLSTTRVYHESIASGPSHEVSNFDSSGFDITLRQATPSRAQQYVAVKLNGASAKLLTSASPTVTGDHTITGAGWTPQFGLMLHNATLAVDTTYTDGNAEVFGLSAFTAGGSATSTYMTDDAVATSNTESITDTKPVRLRKDAADFMTATFSAFTSDGVTFNYSATNASARQRAVLFVQASTAATGSSRRRLQ